MTEGEREFSIFVSPEHAPPINPSPWYAFRYKADGHENIIVHLRYLGSKHRYRPKWRSATHATVLDASVRDDGRTATLVLPPGQAVVSAQELVGRLQYEASWARLERSPRSDEKYWGDPATADPWKQFESASEVREDSSSCSADSIRPKSVARSRWSIFSKRW